MRATVITFSPINKKYNLERKFKIVHFDYIYLARTVVA